ncbi:MAG: hypothetical protein AAF533_25015 [Acidobacteriota bacterium]
MPRAPLRLVVASVLVLLLLGAPSVGATEAAEVQARLDDDLAAGRPIVVHVVVALCDNASQGIVPVPAQLGDGTSPRTNLYWGALYGVRTHLTRTAGWKRLEVAQPRLSAVLERIALRTEVRRKGVSVPVILVADAWDGREIKRATMRFLELTAGQGEETVELKDGETTQRVAIGGAAQLVAYIGHDGLMEFRVGTPRRRAEAPARAAVVLACVSEHYFGPHLTKTGAHPLLMTNGLMAPEAYTLDAAIRAWVAADPERTVHEAAAQAYHRYQKCGVSAARKLFWSPGQSVGRGGRGGRGARAEAAAPSRR